MKKVISLILAFVLCLSLFACNGNNDAPKATETPTEAIDVSSVVYGVGDSKYAEHSYLDDIYGTWEFEHYNGTGDYDLYKSLTINNDGSCIVDGVTANWKIEDDSSSDKILVIGIYVNSECAYGAAFGSNDNGDLYLIASSGPDSPPYQTTFIKQD